MNTHFVTLAVSLLLFSTILPVIGQQPPILSTAGVLKTSQTVGGSDSDNWPMIRHTPSHTGFSESQAPHTNTVFWTSPLDSPQDSSPIVDNEKIYLSSYGGYLHCIDAQNGSIIWEQQFKDCKLPSDPAVDDGRLYISADKLYCLDSSNGSLQWNQTDGALSRAPTIADGKVFVGGDVLFCFNGLSGEMLWKFHTMEKQFFPSPAVTNDSVYVGEATSGNLFCINLSTGMERWNAPLNWYGPSSASLAIDNGRVYVGTKAGWLVCYNATDGSFIWAQTVEYPIQSSPATAYGNVYVGSDGAVLSCYNALTGAFLWNVVVGSPILSSPMVADGNIYISSDKFYCFNAYNGSELWNFSTGGGMSSPAVSNGKVFVASNEGNIYCFRDLNYPPNTPSEPEGPVAAGAGIPLNFSTTTRDPDGDQIFYQWDWGNGNYSDWLGPYTSSVRITTTYTWDAEGDYEIHVKAKDIGGSERNWSEAHPLSIRPQINLTNPKPGYIYFELPSIYNSFLYSQFLDGLGVAVLISTSDLSIDLETTTHVQSVAFKVDKFNSGESFISHDIDSSDGFHASISTTRGLYELTILAYDGNNTFIDGYILPAILYLRMNPSGTRSSGHLQQFFRDRS